jgi:hypothetical protein
MFENAVNYYIDTNNQYAKATQDHGDLYESLSGDFSKYYDLCGQFPEEYVIENHPALSASVKKIYLSAKKLSDARQTAQDALCVSLELAARELALRQRTTANDGNQLISDLETINLFRKEKLDGIDSKLLEVLKMGHGFKKAESKRMINRIIYAWAQVRNIPLARLKSQIAECI